jgi:RHS repeat-associated protein
VHGQNGIILGEYQYNELSQLTTKRLHAFNSSWLQTIDYTYNIQGWLTKINDRELSEATDLFGMEIGYERGILGWNDNTEFGGNISALSWRVRGQGAGKYPTYAYFYDRAGRFTSSFYADRAPNGHNDPFRYDEHLIADGGGNLYDRNGNAAAGFFRNFFNTGANTTVDYLGSIYSGNRLANTRDQGTDLAAMPYDYRDNGATATNTTEYSYDPNGNITNDANAGVSIAYNHLNLVTQITKGTGTIAYTYAADGTLLARSVNGTVATEWMGGFVYKQNGALDYIHTPEGRVVNTPTGFEYEYHYTDHLGSTRLTWRPRNNNGTWTAQIQEVYNYYAYGTLNPSAELGHSITAQTYQYRYTGQWNETALGLNYYRFPARLYDPALGRFTGVDPMAASEGFGSPYAYVGGNPINYSDPTGMARRGIERDDIGGRPTGYSFRSNQLAGYNLLGNFDFYTKSSGLSSTAGPSSPQDTPSGGQWVRVSKEEFHAAAQAGQRVKGDGANEWYVWQPGAEQEGAGFISEYDIPFWGPSKRADEAFRSGTLSGVAEGFFWSGVAFTDLLLVRAVAQTGAKLAGNTAASISTRLALSFEAKLAQRGILGFTEHGAQQMTARGFTQEAVLKIIKEGAVKEVVYNGKPQIHYVLGKYVIATDVTGQFAGKIITIYGDWNVVGANGIRGIFTGF